MGLLLTPTSKIIPAQRLQALTQIPRPQTKRELLSVLVLLNVFRIWVPNFALHPKPLYQATWGNLDESLLAPTSLHTPNESLTKNLLQVPSLYLPDYIKPFFLFVPSWQGHALRILCQERDIWGPLAYLSKQLDLIMLRWPPCLQGLATITLLIPEAQKLTWNAPLNVCSPHSFKHLFSHQAFLSLTRLTTDPPHTPPWPIPFFYAL